MKPKTKKAVKKSSLKKRKIDLKINLLSSQLKTVGILVAIISLPVAVWILPLTNLQPAALYPVEKATKTLPMPSKIPEVSRESTACRLSGGVWREFANSCADWCGNNEAKKICAQVITLGCDCSGQACWNGRKCVETDKKSLPFSSPVTPPLR